MSPAHRDLGAPSSYLLLEPGTPVYEDGQEIGVVKEVIAVPENDIFDGLQVDTGDGERYVPGDDVEALYERGVVLRS